MRNCPLKANTKPLESSSFTKYSEIAIWLSAIYLFVQMVSIIDGMYLWAEFWANPPGDGEAEVAAPAPLEQFLNTMRRGAPDPAIRVR